MPIYRAAIPGPQGPAGPQGEPSTVPGPQGPAGANGATPWTYLGAYDNGVTYSEGDAVTYNGATWRLDTFIGAAGYAPGAYPQWSVLAGKGDTGPAGPAGDPGVAGPAGSAGPAGPAGAGGSDAYLAAPPPASTAIELPPRWCIGTAVGDLIPGTLYGAVFVAPDARTISKVYFYINTWASSGITSFKMGLYKKTGATEWTRVGITSTNHTNTAVGVRELALTASVTLEAGATYAAAVIGVGNAPNMYRIFTGSTAINGNGVPISWSLSSQTDLPSVVNSPSTASAMWCGGVL